MSKPIPDGYHAVTPYLVCADAERAIDFYEKVFGAEERMRIAAPDGKIGHAELVIGGSTIMLADEHPEMGARAPGAFGGSPVTLVLYVADVDATVARAVESGARVQRPVEDKFYGDRMGTIVDPEGHVWHVATHVEDVPQDELLRRAAEVVKAAAG
ncbi:MAG: VOC family protein [Rhodospirillales bacterium]|nr:VOC family protein [Rhodospirillales bacterium]